jgi:hypothetical protein
MYNFGHCTFSPNIPITSFSNTVQRGKEAKVLQMKISW